MYQQWVEALFVLLHRSRAETVWVGALFVSMPMLFGPLASVLTNQFGCRWTTVVGAMVASVGCYASAYTNSPGELCATFGIVSGTLL